MEIVMKFPFFILTFSLTVLPLVYGMNPNTELSTAVLNLDPEEVLKALHNDAHVNTKNRKGDTPLHIIASYNLLHSLICKKQTKVAKILLDAGADFNAQNADDQTPLDLAIMKHNTEIAELITSYLELLKQINSKPTKQLLTQAIDLGFVSLVKLLLKADIKPNLHDLALVKLKYMKSLDNFDKDTYAAIGRMLLQHLRLIGNLQAPEYSTATKLYHWAMNLMQPAHSSTAKHTHGPISKSGITQTGLPEDIIHAIASFTY